VAAPTRFLGSYYLYQATASCVFYSPIFFVYYAERVGLGVAVVLFLQSWALAVRALLDLPFGALADRYSRRACLQASALAYALGAGGLLAWPALVTAVVAETLFAAAAALKSGADSAFLFDALATRGRLDLYARAESRGQAAASLSSGATAVAGGLLAAVDLGLPYVATVIAAAASAAFAGRLGADAPAGRAPSGARGLMRDAAREAARSAGVRWVIALAAFAVVASHVYFYLQQPYLRALGVPVALFGVVFAATKVVTALVAMAAYRVDARLGPLGATAVMAAVPVVGLGAMSAVTVPAGAAFLLTRGLLDGLWQPLMNVYMNRLVASRVRATMLSLQSLVARLALALVLALLGLSAARVGLASTLAVCGAVALAAGAGLVVAGARVLEGPRGALLAGRGACDSREP
jgi:hypothetical protein